MTLEIELPTHPTCRVCHEPIEGVVVWDVRPSRSFVPFEDGAEFARASAYHEEHAPDAVLRGAG